MQMHLLCCNLIGWNINSLSLSLVAQMESTLSEFTDTAPSINKQIYNTYHAHVTNLSRRFFHLLLRYRQYEYYVYVHVHV
jgi:hypothetical protein